MQPEAVIAIKFSCDACSATLAFLRWYVTRNKARTRAVMCCHILLLFTVLIDMGGSAGAAWIMVLERKYREEYKDEPEKLALLVMSTPVLRALFWAHLCYFISLISIKAAYLSFYSELYDRVQSKRKYALYTGWAVWAIASTMAILFLFLWCLPFTDNWNPLTTNPHCPGLLRLDSFSAVATLNISSDIAIFVVPLVIISALKLGKAEKISLVLVFMIGSISVIASVVRFIVVGGRIAAADGSWDTVHIFAVVSHLEAFFAMVAFTLPSFRVLLKKVFGTMVSTRDKSGTFNSTLGGVKSFKRGSIELGYTNIAETSSDCRHGTASMKDSDALERTESQERIFDKGDHAIRVHKTFNITTEERSYSP